MGGLWERVDNIEFQSFLEPNKTYDKIYFDNYTEERRTINVVYIIIFTIYSIIGITSLIT